jgi:hypothetical protein
MADQKNRGGQKKGRHQPEQSEAQQGVRAGTPAERSDADKREDQMTNPDDARRQPTDGQRQQTL